MATPKIPMRSSASGPHLDLQISYHLGVPLLYVKGELDHETASQLRDVIDEELEAGPSALLLEFSGLSYMDSGGLSLVFETLNRLKNKGWLGLVGANWPVSRLMEITALAEQPGLRVLPDLAAATEALRT